MSEITLTAALVAGGLSTRMGRDKATLVIAGEPLWARQLRVLRELQPEAIMISARGLPLWCPPEILVVWDSEPDRGPAGGVAAALAKTDTSHLLVLAVDLPRMTPEHLRKLCEQARPGCGVVPMLDGRFEPLCALYPKAALGTALESLVGTDHSLQTLVRRLEHRKLIQTTPVSPEDAGLYHNLNSPADL